MEEMIPKNSTIPVGFQKSFPTTEKNQQEFVVTVLEGEKRLAKENCVVTQTKITNLRPAKAGEVNVSVRYFVDRNGCFTVEIEDPSRG